MVAEERAVEQARRRRGAREREAEAGLGRGATAQAGSLATQASQEYAYVVRDVRRIVSIGGSLLAILFALFIVIDVAHLIRI